MINYLHCEYPIPLSSGQESQIKDLIPDWSEVEFQTKSLLLVGSPFDKYTISEDGQIYRERISLVCDTEPEEDDLLDISNFSSPEYEGIERVDNFSGEIRFYGIHMTDSFDIWMEFVAFFKKGEFLDIFVTDWRREDSKERIDAEKRINEIFSEIQKNATDPWLRIKSVYKGIVNFFFNFIIKFIFFIKKLIT